MRYQYLYGWPREVMSMAQQTNGATEADKMEYERVCELIESGTDTNKAITEALDSSVGHVGRVLKRWTEEGKLDREKDGHAYRYSVPDSGGEEQEAQQGQANQQAAAAASGRPDGALDELRAPVDRNYDWASMVEAEEEVAEYISHNGEKEEIVAEVKGVQAWLQQVRQDLGDPTPEELVSECRRRENAADEYAPRLPRYMITGPTGCGKTTLAEWLGATLGAPSIEIQFRYDMSSAELLGSPQLVGNNSVWEDGGLTKALLASREGPVVLVLDEVPRARPEVHDTLMDAMDHRGRVKLQGRGNEVIQGVPHNLITVATANIGHEYQHYEMDPAHKRRLGDRHPVDYLGKAYPHKEAQMVSDRTGCPDKLADILVEVANEVRERAEDTTSDVRVGVPTSALIDWAAKARQLSAVDRPGDDGLDNPVYRAGKSLVVRRWYADNDNEAQTVDQIISSAVEGCPYDGEQLAAWAGDEEYVVCTECEYSATVQEAQEEAVLDFMECPECQHHVDRVSAQEMAERGAV